MRRISAVIGWALALLSWEARAQDLKAVQVCTRLSDDVSRLACYDAALGVAKPLIAPLPQTAQPSAAPPLSGAGKTDAQSKFGDSGGLHPESKVELPKTLLAQVRQVTSLPYGRYQLTLDNGQVWRTSEADTALEFKANDQVTILRGVLGSYYISLAQHATSVRVKRVQ